MTLLISYFRTEDESMYLAASHDGFDFEPLNDGAPVLRGEVGSGTLRDPFIGRGPDKRFHMVATDGWSSTSIVHASSQSLRDWSPQTLLPVMGDVPGARNAWAPEFFIDKKTGLANLIWSSVVDGQSATPDWLTGSHEHRIWATTTEDFESFQTTRLFFDPGFSVIDATVQATDPGYVMVFKDERGVNDLDTEHKKLAVTTFAEPWGEFSAPVPVAAEAPVEGPSLFRRDGEWILIFDHYLEGGYGALRSPDGVNWQPAAINLPAGMRHASVLQLPDAELQL